MIDRITSLLNHSSIRRYGSNTLWLLSEKALRMTLGLFIGVWVARYLGPERLGVLSYTQSYIALFTAFASLGLDNIVIRELVKYSDKTGGLLGTSFVLKFVASCMAVIIIYLSLGFQNQTDEIENAVMILSFTIIIQSFNVVDFYFQSEVKSKFIVISNVVSLLISSIAKVYLITNDYPLVYFLYVLLVDALIISFLLILFYKDLVKGKIIYWKYDRELAIYLLKESWPLIFSGFLVTVYMKIDQVMINHMLGSYEVGIYSAAVQLSELWYFIPVVICSSIFPAILNAKKQSQVIYYKRMKHLYFIMFWFSFFISIVMSFIGAYIISFLYGDDYYESTSVLYIHIWASIFVFIGVSNSKYMLAEGFQRLTLIGTLIGGIVNVALNLYLIPLYGVSGAAWSTLISYMLSAYLYLLLIPSKWYIFIRITKAIFYRGTHEEIN
jgi:O-antigen/teichoic acid export membrane protein